MQNVNISDFQDYQDYLNSMISELPEQNESTCQACGSALISKAENVGFDEPSGPSLIEISYECPLGHEQDEEVVIL